MYLVPVKMPQQQFLQAAACSQTSQSSLSISENKNAKEVWPIHEKKQYKEILQN